MGIVDASRPLTIRHLAQTLLASQGELSAMTHLPRVFEDQREYDDVFKARYLDTDPRRIVLAYKTGLMLNRVFVPMEERAPQWMGPGVRRSRNLIWALLIQATLNAKSLDDLLECYGRSLTLEHGFGDSLKEWAAGRVLAVMKEAYSEPANRQKIDAERYTFTKTKEVYQRCMQVAGERYGWSKRSL